MKKVDYSMSFVSLHGKLAMRFFKSGIAYKTKTLSLPASTDDIKNPSLPLDVVMSGYKQEFTAAAWECAARGSGDPYSKMFGYEKSLPSFRDIFDGTNFIEFVGEKFDWDDIDNRLLYEYMEHLESEDYADNTIKKYASDVKVRLDKARNLGVQVPADVYPRILKCKKGTTQSIYLTKTELARLACVRTESQLESAVLDKFLKSAYTGCRFSDVIKLDPSNIVYTEYENAGGIIERVKEIQYVSEKTATLTAVPLKPCLEDMFSVDFGPVTNNQSNTVLPILCRRAGITSSVKVVKADKMQEGEKCDFVRTHTARKSFATNVYISGEYDLRSISKMMGHSSSAVTESTYILCGAIRRTGFISSYFD